MESSRSRIQRFVSDQSLDAHSQSTLKVEACAACGAAAGGAAGGASDAAARALLVWMVLLLVLVLLVVEIT